MVYHTVYPTVPTGCGVKQWVGIRYELISKSLACITGGQFVFDPTKIDMCSYNIQFKPKLVFSLCFFGSFSK